jgi:hypothetical protein
MNGAHAAILLFLHNRVYYFTVALTLAGGGADLLNIPAATPKA